MKKAISIKSIYILSLAIVIPIIVRLIYCVKLKNITPNSDIYTYLRLKSDKYLYFHLLELFLFIIFIIYQKRTGKSLILSALTFLLIYLISFAFIIK
jgi:hypothetical protein